MLHEVAQHPRNPQPRCFTPLLGSVKWLTDAPDPLLKQASTAATAALAVSQIEVATLQAKLIELEAELAAAREEAAVAAAKEQGFRVRLEKATESTQKEAARSKGLEDELNKASAHRDEKALHCTQLSKDLEALEAAVEAERQTHSGILEDHEGQLKREIAHGEELEEIRRQLHEHQAARVDAEDALEAHGGERKACLTPTPALRLNRLSCFVGGGARANRSLARV